MQQGEMICQMHSPYVKWCEHIAEVLKAGKDADFMEPSMKYQVPVFPSTDTFATVVIGDPIQNGSALMWMEFTPDVGKPFKVGLGFWNPGEGLYSIRGVITDWLRSQIDPRDDFLPGPIKTKCPAKSLHSMKHARFMQEMSDNQQWKVECLWNIVMEKACTVCLNMSDPDDGGNYGLDPADFKGRGPITPPSVPRPVSSRSLGTPF